MRKFWSVLAVIAVGSSLLVAQKTQTPKIEAGKIRDAVKYLSSDELEGRGTGQKGGDLAADYIAAQFKSYDLKPAGDNGTYFQQVPMVGVKTLPSTTFTFFPSTGSPVALKSLDNYVTSNETQTPVADIDAPIVFVGYGIDAPEEHWDDYKGFDMKGKVALLFVSEPVSDDPNFFKGKALTYNGRWVYKYDVTARHGAVATLIIHRTDLASYPWEVVRNSWGGERSYLKRDGSPKLEAASWIQLDVAKKLVALAGLDLDKLYQQAQSRDFKPIELPVKLKAHIASDIRPFNSRNVVAKLEGSDPQKRAKQSSTPRIMIISASITIARRATTSITAPSTTPPAAAFSSNSHAFGPAPSPFLRVPFSSRPSPPKSKVCSAPNTLASTRPFPHPKFLWI